MWFSWPSLESFNLWHNEIQQFLGIPRVGTERYTQVIEVNFDDYRAFVGFEASSVYPLLLGIPTTSPFPNSNMNK